MKFLITIRQYFLLLILVPLFGFTQEPLTFIGVVEVPGISNDELFIRGREWFNETFKSSKDVIQIADKETGELSGKGIMEAKRIYKYFGEERVCIVIINFSMSIWVRDGKYRYEISNFFVPQSATLWELGLITTSNETNTKWPMVSKKKMNEEYLYVKAGTEIRALEIIEDLKLKMEKPSKVTNW
jgi:hypothetical protein